MVRTDHFVPAQGREITVRSYQKGSAPSPQTLVWLHGGGWMVGDLNTHDDLCEHLAQFTGHTVLSVHYRRTPENPFPAPLDDVSAVLQWLHRMQGVLPFARDSVLLGGDSAGAHLALACALRHAAAPQPADTSTVGPATWPAAVLPADCAGAGPPQHAGLQRRLWPDPQRHGPLLAGTGRRRRCGCTLPPAGQLHRHPAPAAARRGLHRQPRHPAR
jgi:acetyl esterase/lipase